MVAPQSGQAPLRGLGVTRSSLLGTIDYLSSDKTENGSAQFTPNPLKGAGRP